MHVAGQGGSGERERDPPSTMAPLLRAGSRGGALWAADERGVHRSDDGGRTWTRTAAFETAPVHLTGFAVG